MKRRRLLRYLYYLCVALIAALAGYKIYLNFFEQDFEAVHTRQIDRIQQQLQGREALQFAVLGNINNSVELFERRIIPRLNAAELDFMISAGNAVSSGGEDKYRALHRTLSHLRMPYVLTYGENEHSALGSFRFYEHYGPYFHAFSVGPARLIFLDTTGKTPPAWQLRWLRDELSQTDSRYRFVFMGHPLYRPADETVLDQADQYLPDSPFRAQLLDLLRRHPVDAVFAANAPRFDHQRHFGVDFYTTGGAGGLVLNRDGSFHHYLTVSAGPEGVEVAMERLQLSRNSLMEFIEGLWFFIHSVFYVSYLNFLFILVVLAALALRLHRLLFTERDYYRRYDLDPAPWLAKPMRVAMFSNNYLPFIGGVPLSIERLREGLRDLGDEVLVIAPRYGREEPRAEVVRVPSLAALGSKREFRLANIFARRVRRRLDAFGPGIVHLHHPFWLGSLGLWLARRRRLPVVYTYHTRLEQYAHFVPLPGLLFRNLISHYLIRRFANKCDAVIVPTYSAEEYLRLIGVHTPIHIQPTGIDYRRFQAVADEEVAALRAELSLPEAPVLVSVSRLSAEKNMDFLIDAAARLKAEAGGPFTLLILGDGPERPRLQKRIDELELGDCVRLLGSVPPDDIPRYYRLGDLFVFASQSETQGMVILEAMAAGLPVVAIRSSGIDDVVEEGATGYKTLAALEPWCARVRELLDDEPARRRMAEAARSFAADYDLPCFARAVRGIYAEVLAARGDSSS